MNYQEAMRRLEEYGTAQAQKIYKRHGALPDNVFGVSFANLNVLAKEIKRDHALARALWQSKNYDARNLAVKIAEPKKMDLDELREWGRDVTNYMHAGSLGSLASSSDHYATAIAEWTGSDDEYLINAGYSVLGSALKNNPDCLSDDQVREYLAKIEREIHVKPNWARYSMNWCLISIGTYKLSLTEEAKQVARRIGKVEVDHGETSCKTPDAEPYIERAAAHFKEQLRKRAEKRAKKSR